MADARDIDRLADRYLDLWEQQVGALLADPAGPWSFESWVATFQAEQLRLALRDRRDDTVDDTVDGGN